jgi:hypothetical protein
MRQHASLEGRQVEVQGLRNGRTTLDPAARLGITPSFGGRDVPVS